MVYTVWDRVHQVFTSIFVILAVVVVGISLFRTSDADSLVRFAIQARPENVIPNAPPADLGVWIDGSLTFDSADNVISYIFYYNVSMSPILSMSIFGPRMVGQQTGPLYFSLCGTPGAAVCDLITTPGLTQASLIQVYPGALDPKPIIQAIRDNPFLYYFQAATADYANGLRDDLTKTTAFPYFIQFWTQQVPGGVPRSLKQSNSQLIPNRRLQILGG